MAKLKDLKFMLSLILILVILGGGAGGYFYYSSVQKQLNSKEETINQLMLDIENIGQLVDVYKVASAVKMGKKVEETDLIPVQVPIGTTQNMVMNPMDVVGKYYRVNVSADTVLTYDVIMDSEISDDMRLYDVILNTIPVSLKEGVYVDVRISLPMGEDFIAIAHKKVHAINGGVLKLAITENDIHTYNSMLVDTLLYPGTQIYAVEYIEGGAQKPADTYYPVSSNILAVAQKDPNLLDAIKTDILHRRGMLESSLTTVLETDTPRENIDITLQRGRERLQDVLEEAQRQAEIAAQKAAEEAQQAALLQQQAQEQAQQ